MWFEWLKRLGFTHVKTLMNNSYFLYEVQIFEKKLKTSLLFRGFLWQKCECKILLLCPFEKRALIKSKFEGNNRVFMTPFITDSNFNMYFYARHYSAQ